jgi:hypothetical protein
MLSLVVLATHRLSGCHHRRRAQHHWLERRHLLPHPWGWAPSLRAHSHSDTHTDPHPHAHLATACERPHSWVHRHLNFDVEAIGVLAIAQALLRNPPRSKSRARSLGALVSWHTALHWRCIRLRCISISVPKGPTWSSLDASTASGVCRVITPVGTPCAS